MRRSNADLAEEVAAPDDFSRERLDALWAKAHCHPAPKGIRHELLVRSASWHLQSNRVGGLSPATKRMLKTAMAEAETGVVAARSGTLGSCLQPWP